MPDDDSTKHNPAAQSTQSAQAPEVSDDYEEPAPTPFDHPLFLPVLLAGLTLWFGYDGWLNTDPEMLEHGTFNRVGFVGLLLGTIYTSIKRYREWKEEQE